MLIFRFKEFRETGLTQNHPFLAMDILTSVSSGLIQKSRDPILISAPPVITRSKIAEFLKWQDIQIKPFQRLHGKVSMEEREWIWQFMIK